VPKDFDGAVAQQQQSAEEWDRRHTRVWGKQDRSLVTQAAKLPPEQVTEERLRQARELAVQLRRVANQALAQAEKAEQVVRDFERILNLRQRAEMPGQQVAAGAKSA
jgi:cell division FtsZ-interacting protein ZapD